jgi:hypothetical protein
MTVADLTASKVSFSLKKGDHACIYYRVKRSGLYGEIFNRLMLQVSHILGFLFFQRGVSVRVWKKSIFLPSPPVLLLMLMMIQGIYVYGTQYTTSAPTYDAHVITA